VIGEIVANLIVLAGSLFFVVPGIYLGLRLVFYKQAILFGGLSASEGMRQSFAVTVGWRVPLRILVLLSPFYALPIGAGYLLAAYDFGLLGNLITVAVSTLSFAWTNCLVTVIYINLSGVPGDGS